MTPTTWYHGSGQTLRPGSELTAGKDGYVYLARSPRLADAFAFRDAASLALSQALVDAIAQQSQPNLTGCRVNGTIHTVEVDGPFEPDPDFPTAPDSARTTSPTTVTHSTPGSIRSWREFYSVVGPHKTAYEGVPVYDAQGYLRPLPKWLAWGYPTEHFRRLGPWFPLEGIYQIGYAQTLLVVNELSVHLNFPDPELFIPVIRKLKAGAPLTNESADAAARYWWI